jgi:hypothetical protein
VLRYLEQAHGIRAARSTLSRFLQYQPEAQQPRRAGDPGLSPEQERFLEQREVFEFLKQSDEKLLDQMTRLLARMGVLEDAAAERQRALLDARTSDEGLGIVIDHLKQQAAELEAIKQRLQPGEPQRSMGTGKIFGLALAFWLIVLASIGYVYYF